MKRPREKSRAMAVLVRPFTSFAKSSYNIYTIGSSLHHILRPCAMRNTRLRKTNSLFTVAQYGHLDLHGRPLCYSERQRNGKHGSSSVLRHAPARLPMSRSLAQVNTARLLQGRQRRCLQPSLSQACPAGAWQTAAVASARESTPSVKASAVGYTTAATAHVPFVPMSISLLLGEFASCRSGLIVRSVVAAVFVCDCFVGVNVWQCRGPVQTVRNTVCPARKQSAVRRSEPRQDRPDHCCSSPQDRHLDLVTAPREQLCRLGLLVSSVGGLLSNEA